MSIRLRLALYTASLVGLLFLTTGASIWIQHLEAEHSQKINIAGRQRMLSQKMSKELLALKLGRTEALPKLLKTFTLFERSLSALLRGGETLDTRGAPIILSAASAQARPMLESGERLWLSGRVSIRPVVKGEVNINSQVGEEALKWIFSQNLNLLKEMNTITNAFQAESEEIRGQIDKVNQASLLLGLLMLGFIAWQIQRHIIRPLKQCVVLAEDVSKGDLTQSIEHTLRNEFGQLFDALNQMSRGLNKDMESISQNARELARASEGLEETAEVLSDAVRQTAEVSERSEEESQGLSQRVSEAVEGVEEAGARLAEASALTSQVKEEILNVSSDSDQVTTSVSSVAAAVEEMAATLGEVAQNTARAAEISSKASLMANATTHNVEALSSAAREIEQILGLIKGIAAQTNLLALNATIEAASAGEAGKGFAVVAHEVKILAKQTAHATENIEKTVSGMRREMEKASTSIGEVEATVAELNEINGSIAVAVEEQSMVVNSVGGDVARSAGQVSEINAKLQSVVTSTQALSDDIKRADERLEAAIEGDGGLKRTVADAETLSARMGALRERAQGARDETAQQREAARALVDLAVDLKRVVDQFKLEG